MSSPHVSPALSLKAFNCPRCGALAHQEWFRSVMARLPEQAPNPRKVSKSNDSLASLFKPDSRKLHFQFTRLSVNEVFYLQSNEEVQCLSPLWASLCFACNAPSIWINDRIIEPPTSRAPLPNPDLPPSIMKVYAEARSILELSPSGAAALLRKALEMLCVHLGANEGTLYGKINTVMEKPDFSDRARKAAHTIRLFGNDVLHADAEKLGGVEFSSIHEDDDVPTAEGLFAFLNFIAEHAITNVNKIDAWHDHADAKDKVRKENKKLSGKASGKGPEAAST